jgi:hypothetical protein
MTQAEKQTGENLIGKGQPGPGRPAGVPNKTTALLKDAILLAAEEVGQDGKGKSGLIGYCKFLATSEPKAFASLMGRVLPTQVVGDADNPVGVIFQTVYEAPPKA